MVATLTPAQEAAIRDCLIHWESGGYASSPRWADYATSLARLAQCLHDAHVVPLPVSKGGFMDDRRARAAMRACAEDPLVLARWSLMDRAAGAYAMANAPVGGTPVSDAEFEQVADLARAATDAFGQALAHCYTQRMAQPERLARW